jgi:hypothetical protein
MHDADRRFHLFACEDLVEMMRFRRGCVGEQKDMNRVVKTVGAGLESQGVHIGKVRHKYRQGLHRRSRVSVTRHVEL